MKRFLSLVFCVAGVTLLAAQSTKPAAALKIVVVEGEDAVNIVQQKTATAPVVEVRDRNGQPVGGAMVKFAIKSGHATFGGARNISVVTNAAGRATATGLAPSGSGALQISASAAFQGQSAAITIAQTNVMTAAEAATASSAGASGGGAGAGTASGGGAAGGAGGGLSATTIGIVGGAAAGGLVVAQQTGLIGGGTKYSASFRGTMAMVFNGGCTRNETQSGTIEIELDESGSSVSGTARVGGHVDIVQPNPCGPPGYTQDALKDSEAPVSGTKDAITFTSTESNNYTDPDGSTGVNSYTYTFAGSLNGAEVVGTLNVKRTITNSKGPIPGVGSIDYHVTLRK